MQELKEKYPDQWILVYIGKGVLSARLARLELIMLGTRKELVQLTIKAYLAEDDAVPLLFGVEDLLTNSRLVCDYSKGKAFLQVE